MTYYVSTDMYYNNDYLQHYGVKGMKWGKRMARGHAGPGIYLTRKRQLAGDKRDLERLNKGEHLSVGLTKKRQAAYDARDKAALEKRIAKNEAHFKAKADKKAERAKKGSSATANVLKTIGKQTAKGVLTTTAGIALRKSGAELAGTFLTAYGAGTLAGTALGGTMGLVAARKIDKRNRTN